MIGEKLKVRGETNTQGWIIHLSNKRTGFHSVRWSLYGCSEEVEFELEEERKATNSNHKSLIVMVVKTI